VGRKPGHRRQTAIEPTGGRLFPPGRSACSPRRLAATPFSPSALTGEWARSDAVTLAHRAVSPSLMGRRWAVSAPARALAPGVGQKPCPQPRKGEISFLFIFHPISHLNSFLNILCTKKIIKKDFQGHIQ
jgi:hypothetical protein